MILEKVFEDLQKQDIRQGLVLVSECRFVLLQYDYKFQFLIHV